MCVCVGCLCWHRSGLSYGYGLLKLPNVTLNMSVACCGTDCHPYLIYHIYDFSTHYGRWCVVEVYRTLLHKTSPPCTWKFVVNKNRVKYALLRSSSVVALLADPCKSVSRGFRIPPFQIKNLYSSMFGAPTRHVRPEMSKSIFLNLIPAFF